MEGLEALPFAINELKAIVPIWKKVIYILAMCDCCDRELIRLVIVRKCMLILLGRGNQMLRSHHLLVNRVYIILTFALRYPVKYGMKFSEFDGALTRSSFYEF